MPSEIVRLANITKRAASYAARTPDSRHFLMRLLCRTSKKTKTPVSRLTQKTYSLIFSQDREATNHRFGEQISLLAAAFSLFLGLITLIHHPGEEPPGWWENGSQAGWKKYRAGKISRSL